MRDELGGDSTAEDKLTETSKGNEAAWPLDLNTYEFRKGLTKAEAAPAWGFDPGVTTPST